MKYIQRDSLVLHTVVHDENVLLTNDTLLQTILFNKDGQLSTLPFLHLLFSRLKVEDVDVGTVLLIFRCHQTIFFLFHFTENESEKGLDVESVLLVFSLCPHSHL